MPCFGRKKKTKKSAPLPFIPPVVSGKSSPIPSPIPSSRSLKGKELYDHISQFIKPLDLIAFRGGDVISDLITFLEKETVGVDTFSHVGMVVTKDILDSYDGEGGTFDLDPSKLYVLESTFSYDVAGRDGGGMDVIKEKGYFGVQLRDLETVVKRYISSDKTKVAWCRLLDNPFDESGARGLVKQLFTRLFTKYYGIKYDLDAVDLLAAIFPALRDAREIKDIMETKLCKLLSHFTDVDVKSCPSGWQFCSELVANIYKGLGIMEDRVDTRNVLPVDFFGDDADDELPRLVDTPIYFEGW